MLIFLVYFLGVKLSTPYQVSINHLFGVDARFMTIQPLNAEDKYFKEMAV